MTELANNPFLTEALGKVLGGTEDQIPVDATPQSDVIPVNDEIPKTDTNPATDAAPQTDAIPKDVIPETGSDATFLAQFADFQLDSIDDIKSALSNTKEVSGRNVLLEQEIVKLRSEPYFEDPNEKRMFDYVKTYKGSDSKRAFQDYLELEDTDIEKLDNKKALEMAFVLSKKSTPKLDALKQFEYAYKKTYQSFDPDDDEEKEITRLNELDAVQDAKQKLAELKTQYGQKPKEQFMTPDQKAAEVVINRSVEESLRAWDENLSRLTEYPITVHGLGEVKINVDENERTVINKILRPLVENKANYQPNGTIKADLKFLVDREIQSVLFSRALEKVALEAGNKAREEAYATIALRQPERMNVGGQGQGQPNPLQQQGDAILAHFKR